MLKTILIFCLLVVSTAQAATITFGTDGTEADIISALDAASIGDSLVQAGASVQTLTSAKTYTGLTDITIVGDGNELTVATSGSGAVTFTGCDGLSFNSVDSLQVPMTLNGSDTIFRDCLILCEPGSTLPSSYVLIYCIGGADISFYNCQMPYQPDASPERRYTLQTNDSNTYNLLFDGCTINMGMYITNLSTSSNLTVIDTTVNAQPARQTGAWIFGYAGSYPDFNVITLTNSTFDDRSVYIDKADSLISSGCHYTVGLNAPTGGGYSNLFATVNYFSSVGDTMSYGYTANASGSTLSNFNLRKWSSVKDGCKITECVTNSHSSLTYPNWMPFEIESGFNNGTISNNTIGGGTFYFWTDSSTDNQSRGWVISGNTVSPSYRQPIWLVGGFKYSEFSGNTFSGDLGIAIASIGGRNGIADTLSGHNVFSSNTFSQSSDSCAITSLLLTSGSNIVRLNTFETTGTGERSNVGIISTMPLDSIYNNDFNMTNGTIPVSHFGTGGGIAYFNNRHIGDIDYAVTDGNYSSFTNSYPDYATIARTFKGYGDSLSFAHDYTIGYSQLGLPIIGLKLSDNASASEDEPGIGLFGGIHGDEQPSCMVVSAIADSLTRGYSGSVARITALLDNSEVWLIPNQNPDGYMMNSRLLLNGADQNRDFPDGSTSEANTEPSNFETAAIWNFYSDNDIAVSADIHNGINKALYPYGGVASASDEATLSALCDAYVAVSYDASITAKASSIGPFAGSHADWAYRYGGSMCNIIEFSIDKQITPADLPARWDGMMNSFFSYLEEGLNGVYGVITAATGGTDIAGAEVNVDGYTGGQVYTRHSGYYFRPIIDGSYIFSYSVTGYDDDTTTVVVTGLEDNTQTLTGDGTGYVARDSLSMVSIEDATISEMNNDFAGATITTFSESEATLSSTSFDASTGLTAGQIDARQNWGGTSATGITASDAGLYPIGIQTAQKNDPVISLNQASLETPVNALLFMRTIQQTGIELDWYIHGTGKADAMNMDNWLDGTHPNGSGTWEAQSQDTLKVVRVR